MLLSRALHTVERSDLFKHTVIGPLVGDLPEPALRVAAHKPHIQAHGSALRVIAER